MASYDIIKAAYATTAVRRDQYPEGNVPEVAFLGRSNVGKSSLINSLCNHRGLARVSGAPGKTQTINYFSAALRRRDEEEGEQRLPFYLVDLPGYGFAKVSQSERERWGKLMEDFFAAGLFKLGVMIVDARHKPTADDVTMADWFKSTGHPLVVVANKLDKLKKSEIEPNLALIRETLELPEDVKLIPFSAEKGQCREVLLAEITALL